MLKKILLTFGLIFLLLAVLIFRPVPIVAEEEAIVVQGTVSSIYESGVKDISIKLKDVPTLFYINRGLEQGLIIDSLRKKLLKKSVTIKYPDYWTPLDWNNRIKHISKLEFNQEVLFNELK